MTISRRARWLALVAALLGWMFDGLEIGLFPLVGRPALKELLASSLGEPADEKLVATWFGVINSGFLIGAATGGVLFGWLGDHLGRVRAMMLSVLLYAGCSGLAAFSASPWQLAALRFSGALGMGGEWALGVALVMELWPGDSRAWMAGTIGAFGNLGYFVLGCLALALNAFGSDIPRWLGSLGLNAEAITLLTRNSNWRLLMLCGAAPALLTLFIRAFVPESPLWKSDRARGQVSHWSSVDLLAVLLGAGLGAGVLAMWVLDVAWALRIVLTLLGVVLVAVCYLFPVAQYLRRSGLSKPAQMHTLGRMLLAAGLSGVPLLATWGGVMWMYNWVDVLAPGDPNARPLTQASSSFGSAVGALLAALLGSRIGRKPTYALLCVASAIYLFGFYTLNSAYGLVFLISAGFLGVITSAFYGWLPLYLPELFPTAIRATGQGFGFNFGRVLASIGSLQTGALLAAFGNDYATACSVAAGVYVFGLLLIAFAPETRGQPLPE